MNEAGTTLLEDEYRWPLAHSESGVDKALKLYSSLVMRRDHLALRVSSEKSVVPPGLSGWLGYLRADGAHTFMTLVSFHAIAMSC